MGYIERLPIQLNILWDEATVKRLLEEKGMTAYTFLSNKRERIDVDVLAGKSLAYESYEQRKVMIDIDEQIQVPVIAIDDLIALKQEANRTKDVEDVHYLLRLEEQMNQKIAIDRFALKRDKEMTPGARLDWLAAACMFVHGQKSIKKEPVQKDSSR